MAKQLTGGRVLLWSLLGRLPSAMSPIGTLLLVSRNTGSVWSGSLVAGALAGGQAIGGPIVGRLADRRGQRTVGLAAALANAAALVMLVAASERELALGWQIAPAALTGLSVPLVGPLSRSRWVRLATGDAELTSAMLSLDGIVDEVAFTAGPALVGVLAGAASPAVGLLTAAVLSGICAGLFALHPTAAPGVPASSHPHDPSARRLLSTPYVLLLAGTALLGACFGSVQVGVTATTEALGRPGAAGLVYGFLGCTSSLAGVVIASMPARQGLPARLRAGAALLFAASCVLLLTNGGLTNGGLASGGLANGGLANGSLATLTAAIGLLGVAVAPQIITIFGLVERTVPATRLGEAMAALVSALILAQSAGTFLAGWAADHFTPGAPFAVTSAAAAAALVLAACTATDRRYRRRNDPARTPTPGEARTADRAGS
ncbi:MFS transporter [Kitasatospora sp. NPDC097691]|uniref:MFS transporter n=1 Tax=Kitasatospora sp. NPDC097691 TaxID=3157231 RepID=UPI003323BDA2